MATKVTSILSTIATPNDPTMNAYHIKLFIITLASSAWLSSPAHSENFYLDSLNGKDSNSGRAPDQAWKSLSEGKRESISAGRHLGVETRQPFRRRAVSQLAGRGRKARRDRCLRRWPCSGHRREGIHCRGSLEKLQPCRREGSGDHRRWRRNPGRLAARIPIRRLCAVKDRIVVTRRHRKPDDLQNLSGDRPETRGQESNHLSGHGNRH